MIIKFFNLFLLFYLVKRSHSQNEVNNLLERLRAFSMKFGGGSVVPFAQTPNHSPKNCLFIYSPKFISQKFSGLVCYELEIYFKSNSKDKDRTPILNLGIKKIFTAYMNNNENNSELKRSTIKEVEKLSIHFITGNAVNWLNENKIKFLFIDETVFNEDEVFNIDFSNPKNTTLAFFPDCGGSDARKLPQFLYSKCKSSKTIKVPFGLGNLKFTFIVCKTNFAMTNSEKNPTLGYNLEVEGNFSEKIRKFEDERFADRAIVFQLFNVLKEFKDTSNIKEEYFEDLIRLPEKSEAKILENKFGSLFNLKSGFFERYGYFKGDSASKNDSRFFSDEEYKKYEEEEESNDSGVDENGKGKEKNELGNNDREKEKGTSGLGRVISFLFFAGFLGLIGFCSYYYCYKKSKKL